MYLFWTIAAAVTFTAGGAFMKASDGMTRFGLTFAMYASFAAGATFQALALRQAELGVAYMFSLGLEAVLIFAFGQVFFAEQASLPKVVGVATIIVGMFLMHRGEAPSRERAEDAPNSGPVQTACLTGEPGA